MKAVVQRVRQASVTVGGNVVNAIEQGFLVLLGVAQDDSLLDIGYIKDKIAHLRIFEDAAGKLNLSILDIGGEMLIISQFTLLADCSKGRRPSFHNAAGPAMGKELYDECVTQIAQAGIKVKTGIFGADMQVALINDGPVTIVLDSKKGY